MHSAQCGAVGPPRGRSLYAIPPAPPPPGLRDSGLGGMAPTEPNFFLCMLPFHQTIHALSARLARWGAIASRQRRESAIIAYIPPYPQTHIPLGGMHVVVVGRAQAPPPWEPPPPPTVEPPIPSCPPVASSGERPIGAAKGKQSDTEALCQPPPPHPPADPPPPPNCPPPL